MNLSQNQNGLSCVTKLSKFFSVADVPCKAEGNAMPCLVSTLLEDGPDEAREKLIRDCAGVMYAAGVDSVCVVACIPRASRLIERMFSNFLVFGDIALILPWGHLVSFVL